MAREVIMPKMGYDMTEGVLARWLKHPGDSVRRGEPLAEVETDKVTIDIEAFADGRVDTLLVEEGARVPVGTPIATLETAATAGTPEAEPVGAGEGGEATPSQARAGVATATVTTQRTGPGTAPGEERPPRPTPQAGGPIPASMAAPAASPPDTGRLKASPLARKLAKEHGIDLADVTGSGPNGRIVRADLEPRLSPPTPAKATPAKATLEAPVEPSALAPATPLSRGQQAVGRVMTLSKQTVPHFYVTLPVTMDAALALRTELNAVLPDVGKVGILELVVKATGQALAATPAMRRRYLPEGPTDAEANVAVAVALPDGAIVSPVLQAVDRTPLTTLARASRQAIRDARAGRLKPAHLQGATLTVSSLGGAGVESFAAIITPPESGVLAVGSIVAEPVVQDGTIVIAQRLRLTLSADHRLVGGVQAADFLHAIRDRLEAPYRLLLDPEAVTP